MRRQLSVADRVLDILVAEPGLQRPRVVAGIGQCIAATVPQHVRMDRERHLGPHPYPSEQRVERLVCWMFLWPSQACSARVS